MEEWIQDDWRELGFYAAHSDEGKERRLVGSRDGLRRFRDLLLRYVADPRNTKESEHEHYGPYSTLEVMTATSAGMDHHAIFGTLEDLARLAEIVDRALKSALPGALIRISREYAEACDFALLLDVRDDGFDPPAAEAQLYGADV